MEDNQPISVSHEKRLERRQDDRRQQRLVAAHGRKEGKERKCFSITSKRRRLQASTLACELPNLLTRFHACLRASKFAYELPRPHAYFSMTFLSVSVTEKKPRIDGKILLSRAEGRRRNAFFARSLGRAAFGVEGKTKPSIC